MYNLAVAAYSKYTVLSETKQNKNLQAMQSNKKWPCTGKKRMETVPEAAQVLDILDKDFNS